MVQAAVRFESLDQPRSATGRCKPLALFQHSESSHTRSQRFFISELQGMLDLVRRSIRNERQKVAACEQRILELEAVEKAYHSQQRVMEELRADRDFWREIAETLHRR